MQLRRSRSGPLIGLTPLIDVVFILLLFFMLATNFQQWRSLDLIGSASQAQAPSAKPRQSLLVRLGVDGLTVAGRPTQEQTLIEDLQGLLRAQPRARVVVWAADGVELQRLIGVMDQLRDAGIRDARFDLQQ